MNIREKILAYQPYDEQEEADKKMMLEYIDTFSDVLTRENRFGHFTSSSLIVNPDRTKTLLIYHNIYQSWAWTGGHADGDDDFLAVALKEANEETGLKKLRPLTSEIVQIDMLPVASHIKHGKPVSSHQHLSVAYILEADENEPLTIKPDENQGVKWFPIEEMVKVTSEEFMKPVYQKLINKAKMLP